MLKRIGCALLSIMIVGSALAAGPVLNIPNNTLCSDPVSESCSQDFYWDAVEHAQWYDVFRRTLQQTSGTTAWVKVGTAYGTQWWTAQDAGDSEVNASGEVRAGQQKPGFQYEYAIRACRLIPDTWTIVCTGFSQSVLFEGVTYERTIQ